MCEETQRASEEARGIVADVQRAVLAALSEAQDGSARAQAGARVAAETGDIIRDLSNALRQSSRAAREIAHVAQQQEGAIEQVLKAMNAIAHATEGAVAVTHHVEKEARSLHDLATSLKTAVKP
jgi:methyl-accepting chemotaxis protein